MTKHTILVVDDEANIRDILEFFLREAGYEVAATGDPDEALALAREGGPDLVLMDVVMPRMDGFDLCQMMHTHAGTAGIPVVFLTALGDDISRECARVSGGSFYLQKPFTREEVLEAVRQGLASRPPAPPRAGRGWSHSMHL
jgi:CheY-like chemotaxis protein